MLKLEKGQRIAFWYSKRPNCPKTPHTLRVGVVEQVYSWGIRLNNNNDVVGSFSVYDIEKCIGLHVLSDDSTAENVIHPDW